MTTSNCERVGESERVAVIVIVPSLFACLLSLASTVVFALDRIGVGGCGGCCDNIFVCRP